MDGKFIVANWKSNKKSDEAKEWFAEISNLNSAMQNQISNLNKTVIICPPFTLLSEVKSLIQTYELPFEVGAQNVSAFPMGSSTGEVAAVQIKEFATYVLIGHSERRDRLKETDEEISEKVKRSKEAGLEVILCVQSASASIPQGVNVVAYEPVFAIGTGNPDTPQNANEIAGAIKAKNISTVLYGGSVNSENVSSFTRQQSIDGVLVGSKSLDAREFFGILKNA